MMLDGGDHDPSGLRVRTTPLPPAPEIQRLARITVKIAMPLALRMIY